MDQLIGQKGRALIRPRRIELPAKKLNKHVVCSIKNTRSFSLGLMLSFYTHMYISI